MHIFSQKRLGHNGIIIFPELMPNIVVIHYEVLNYLHISLQKVIFIHGNAFKLLSEFSHRYLLIVLFLIAQPIYEEIIYQWKHTFPEINQALSQKK